VNKTQFSAGAALAVGCFGLAGTPIPAFTYWTLIAFAAIDMASLAVSLWRAR
jgi:hypothetical protein